MCYKFNSKKDVYKALDEIISGALFGDEYLPHEEVVKLADAVREFVSGAVDRPKFEQISDERGDVRFEAITDLCAAGRALYDAYGVICPEVDAYIIMALSRVNDALDFINDNELKLAERAKK